MRLPVQSKGANRNYTPREFVFPIDQIIPSKEKRDDDSGEDVCLDKYLDCQLDCNSQYPEEKDSPNNLNEFQRDFCIGGCDEQYNLCADLNVFIVDRRNTFGIRNLFHLAPRAVIRGERQGVQNLLRFNRRVV